MWTKDNLKINSPEWGIMNQRRGHLITKSLQGILTKEEEIEYKYLQKLSLDIINENFPFDYDQEKETKLETMLNSIE